MRISPENGGQTASSRPIRKVFRHAAWCAVQAPVWRSSVGSASQLLQAGSNRRELPIHAGITSCQRCSRRSSRYLQRCGCKSTRAIDCLVLCQSPNTPRRRHSRRHSCLDSCLQPPCTRQTISTKQGWCQCAWQPAPSATACSILLRRHCGILQQQQRLLAWSLSASTGAASPEMRSQMTSWSSWPRVQDTDDSTRMEMHRS